MKYERFFPWLMLACEGSWLEVTSLSKELAAAFAASCTLATAGAFDADKALEAVVDTATAGAFDTTNAFDVVVALDDVVISAGIALGGAEDSVTVGVCTINPGGGGFTFGGTPSRAAELDAAPGGAPGAAGKTEGSRFSGSW